MNELNIVSSLLCFVPATYLAYKFFHLNRGINNYTELVQNLNEKPSEDPVVPFKPNLTLIRCQKCKVEDPPEHFQKVVSQ